MYRDHYDDLIPYDWTADQAHAVVNFLELLADAIWARYGPAISRDSLTPPVTARDPLQLRLPLPPRYWGTDADIPF